LKSIQISKFSENKQKKQKEFWFNSPKGIRTQGCAREGGTVVASVLLLEFCMNTGFSKGKA
jgi:hypothetical protein